MPRQTECDKLRKPKLIRQQNMRDLRVSEPDSQVIVENVLKDAINELAKQDEQKDSQSNQMIEKLSARIQRERSLSQELAKQLEAERLEHEKKEFELLEEIARAKEAEERLAVLNKQMEELEAKIQAEREAEAEQDRIRREIEANKKKVKRLTMKRRTEKQNEKFANLSAGKSAVATKSSGR